MLLQADLAQYLEYFWVIFILFVFTVYKIWQTSFLFCSLQHIGGRRPAGGWAQAALGIISFETTCARKTTWESWLRN